VYRERFAAVLGWIDSLALEPGSKVLEIGCGAGFMAVSLAQRGFHVHAIDSVEAMVELAHRHAMETRTADLLSLDVGNVYSLAFENDSFDLVFAIGLIPVIEWPELAVQEMARVTKPGGHIILTSLNRGSLTSCLDPFRNPVFSPLKVRVKDVLKRFGLRRTWWPAKAHSRHFIDLALKSTGLLKARDMTLGFGPFTLASRTVLPEPFSTKLHHRLQHLADKRVPGLRSGGEYYLVLARKPLS
jgi:ubiquinone/menaquinone biosynthesis C-methylase UbiE